MREYAIVDLRGHTLSHYQADVPGVYPPPRVYTAADTMSFACLPTVTFRVGALFDGAPDTTL